MKLLFDFSIFAVNGMAYGKACYSANLDQVPKAGELFDIVGFAISQASEKTPANSDKLHASFKLSSVRSVSKIDNSDIPADDSVVVELSDLILKSGDEIETVKTLEAMGFDIDLWTLGEIGSDSNSSNINVNGPKP